VHLTELAKAFDEVATSPRVNILFNESNVNPVDHNQKVETGKQKHRFAMMYPSLRNFFETQQIISENG
jgi:hypothetical protein